MSADDRAVRWLAGRAAAVSGAGTVGRALPGPLNRAWGEQGWEMSLVLIFAPRLLFHADL